MTCNTPPNGRFLGLAVLMVAALLGGGSCSDDTTAPDLEPRKEVFRLRLTSPAFDNDEPIPARYAYAPDGRSVSPPLRWEAPPEGTRQLALLVEDPDAPYPDRPREEGPWVHWILYSLSPGLTELPEGIETVPTPARPAGARQGVNSFGEIGWGGPQPPEDSPPHRYLFTIYALDAMVDLPTGASRQQFLDAIEGHVLDKGRLVGTYER